MWPMKPKNCQAHAAAAFEARAKLEHHASPWQKGTKSDVCGSSNDSFWWWFPKNILELSMLIQFETEINLSSWLTVDVKIPSSASSNAADAESSWLISRDSLRKQTSVKQRTSLGNCNRNGICFGKSVDPKDVLEKRFCSILPFQVHNRTIGASVLRLRAFAGVAAWVPQTLHNPLRVRCGFHTCSHIVHNQEASHLWITGGFAMAPK